MTSDPEELWCVALEVFECADCGFWLCSLRIMTDNTFSSECDTIQNKRIFDLENWQWARQSMIMTNTFIVPLSVFIHEWNPFCVSEHLQTHRWRWEDRPFSLANQCSSNSRTKSRNQSFSHEQWTCVGKFFLRFRQSLVFKDLSKWSDHNLWS